MCDSRSERCANAAFYAVQAFHASNYGAVCNTRMIRTTGPGGNWKVPIQLLVYCAVDQSGPASQAAYIHVYDSPGDAKMTMSTSKSLDHGVCPLLHTVTGLVQTAGDISASQQRAISAVEL